MQLPPYLQTTLTTLQRIYPQGVPEGDYLALLVALHDLLSDRNLAAVVAELIDGETVVVANDAAAAQSIRRPKTEDVKRIRAVLAENGLVDEESDL